MHMLWYAEENCERVLLKGIWACGCNLAKDILVGSKSLIF